MDSQNRRTQKVRRVLLIVILATLPFYCLGFIVLWGAARLQKSNPGTPTFTQTGTANPTITKTPPTLVYFPTQTLTMTPTNTNTPTITYTPTQTLTNTPTPTETPTLTPTFTETATETSIISTP